MTRVNGHGPKESWECMYPAEPVPITVKKREMFRAAGLDDEAIEALASQEMWANNLYVVIVERRLEDGSVRELSIRRVDRKPIRDWRHFQRIKTEIAGPDAEAMELYPAEDRLMDSANQYYLFCLPPGVRIPIGYDNGRNIKNTAEVLPVGAVQRPLPEDWK